MPDTDTAAQNTAAPNPIAQAIDIAFKKATVYDPGAGRAYIPTSKVVEVKAELEKLVAEHIVETDKKIKENLSLLKIQEMLPDKHYFVTVPKEASQQDMDALVAMCNKINANYPDVNVMRVILSRGVEANENANNKRVEAFMETLGDQLIKLVTGVNGALFPTASIKYLRTAMDKLGKELGKEYYLIDKADIKK